jgi:methylglutaconyl-CoA hydratase
VSEAERTKVTGGGPGGEGQPSPQVRLEPGDGVATVVLDSPANRNALSSTLLAQLRDRLRAATTDQSVRVVVLTGDGPVFSSGADLKELFGGAGPEASTEALAEVLDLLWHSPTPVVARLNGPARAGGVGLLAACDVVVAPPDVTFSFTEVRIGVVPAIIAVPVLRRLPQAAALHLFLTGEVFDAARARELGLVNVVAAAPGHEELDAAVAGVVDSLLRGAPDALATTKRITRDLPGMTFADGLRAMAELSARAFAGPEGREGIAAFAEKRPPAWVPAPPDVGVGGGFDRDEVS